MKALYSRKLKKRIVLVLIVFIEVLVYTNISALNAMSNDEFFAIEDVTNLSGIFETTVPGEGAIVSGNHVNGEAGGMVIVSIDINGNHGLAGLQLEIGYDSNVLKIKAPEKLIRDDALQSLTFVGVNSVALTSNPFKASWAGSTNGYSNGDLLKIEFSISDTAKEGVYPIILSYSQANTVDENGIPVPITTINGSVTIHELIYDGETQFTVRFDGQGGAPTPTIQTITQGRKAIEPATIPQKTGYAFNGWYKETACLNLWNFAIDEVTSDITLYAGWISNNGDNNDSSSSDNNDSNSDSGNGDSNSGSGGGNGGSNSGDGGGNGDGNSGSGGGNGDSSGSSGASGRNSGGKGVLRPSDFGILGRPRGNNNLTTSSSPEGSPSGNPDYPILGVGNPNDCNTSNPTGKQDKIDPDAASLTVRYTGSGSDSPITDADNSTKNISTRDIAGLYKTIKESEYVQQAQQNSGRANGGNRSEQMDYALKIPKKVRVLEVISGPLAKDAAILTAISNTGIPVISIGRMNIPLYAPKALESWALANLVLCILGAVLAAIAIIRVILMRKREMDATTIRNNVLVNKRRYNAFWLIASVALGIAGVSVFILMQDMANLMVLIDMRVIVNAIIILAEVIAILLAFRRSGVTRV